MKKNIFMVQSATLFLAVSLILVVWLKTVRSTADIYFSFAAVIFSFAVLAALIEYATTFPKKNIFGYLEATYSRWFAHIVSLIFVISVGSFMFSFIQEPWEYAIILVFGLLGLLSRWPAIIAGCIVLGGVVVDALISFSLTYSRATLFVTTVPSVVFAAIVLALLATAQLMKRIEFVDEVLPTMVGHLRWLLLAIPVVVLFTLGGTLSLELRRMIMLALMAVTFIPAAHTSIKTLVRERTFPPWLPSSLLTVAILAIGIFLPINAVIAPLIIIAILLIAGVRILRRRYPDLEHPFKIKKLNFVLVVSLLPLLYILYYLEYSLVLGSILAGASILYFIIDVYYTESMAIFLHSTPFRRLLQMLFITKYVKKNICSIIPADAKVLVYGGIKGGIATWFTKVVITNRSKKRINQLHDYQGFLDKPSNVNPAVGRVDAVVMPFTLSTLEHPGYVLGELNVMMPMGGSLIIIDLDKLSYCIPNTHVSSNKRIHQMMQNFGFEATIKRTWMLGAVRVLITAKKVKHATSLRTWYTARR